MSTVSLDTFYEWFITILNNVLFYFKMMRLLSFKNKIKVNLLRNE